MGIKCGEYVKWGNSKEGHPCGREAKYVITQSASTVGHDPAPPIYRCGIHARGWHPAAWKVQKLSEKISENIKSKGAKFDHKDFKIPKGQAIDKTKETKNTISDPGKNVIINIKYDKKAADYEKMFLEMLGKWECVRPSWANVFVYLKNRAMKYGNLGSLTTLEVDKIKRAYESFKIRCETMGKS